MELGVIGGATGGSEAVDAMSLTDEASAVLLTSNVTAATSALSLTQTVVLAVVKVYPVTHTLTFAQSAFAPSQIFQTVADTLTFSDLGEEGVFAVSASHTLNLTDTVGDAFHPVLVVDDELALVDLAHLTERDAAAVDNLSTLVDLATAAGPIYVTAADKLTITTTQISPTPPFAWITTTTGMVDAVAVTTLHNNQQTGDLMSFGQIAIGANARANGTAVSASDALLLGDVANLSIPVSASDTMSLSDIAGVGHANAITADTMALAQVVSLAINHAPVTIPDPLSLSDAVSFILEQGCSRFLFAPNIGSNSSSTAPAPPPSKLPAAAATTGFRLFYPATGPATATVVLSRGPEFGNIDRFTPDRVNRESRGGTLFIFADPIWPKFHTLVLKFSSLKKSDAYALRNFMAAYPGQKIGLIDWENRAWSGVITNQQDPMIQDDRNSFTSSFEFQGERVTT